MSSTAESGLLRPAHRFDECSDRRDHGDVHFGVGLGLARDWHPLRDCHDPGSPTTLRDRFFAAMFACVVESAVSGGPIAGSNIWVWSGVARPGETYIGDPPHEAPGWYSVYEGDTQTLKVIAKHSADLSRRAQGLD